MAGTFTIFFIGVIVASISTVPYMTAEARYLPTRSGNDGDDRLIRLKELISDLLESGVKLSNLDERPYYGDSMVDYKRSLRPLEYNVIPEKSMMELFNPTASHHQRPRS